MLEAAGLAPDDNGEIVVRRELARSGRHRAFVNDSAVTVALLERLGDVLVEVHGQHEHQRLLEPLPTSSSCSTASPTPRRRARASAPLHAKHRAARDEAERTRGAARDRAQREDLLRFQVSELDAARLRLGEDEELRTELRRVQHAERFTSGLTEAAALLADAPQSAAERLARAARILQDLGRLESDPGRAGGADRGRADPGRRGAGGHPAAARRDVAEPGRLDAIHERLDALTRLKRKYGDGEEAMLLFRDEAARELERLERHEEVVAEQERLLAELEAELTAAAMALSDPSSRRRQRLASQVEKALRGLGMERAVFEVGLEAAPERACEAPTA